MKNNHRLRFRHLLLVAAGLTASAVSTPAASAQVTGHRPADFTGVWQHAKRADEEQQRQSAIKKATEDMSIFIRGTARDRLREKTAPPSELTLKVTGEDFTIVNQDRTVSLRLNGKPVTREKDGKRVTLSARSVRNQIVLVSKGEKAERTNTYTLSKDKMQLTMSVKMTGERLSAPVAYKASFKRK